MTVCPPYPKSFESSSSCKATAMCVLYRFRKVGRGCFFATLYISSLSTILSRFNCVMDKIYPTHHLKHLYDCLLTCYLIVWCIPCAWSGDRTSVVVTTVVVTPTQSCVQLPGLLSSASFDGGNRSYNGLVRVWPAIKKQSCILMVGMLSRW